MPLDNFKSLIDNLAAFDFGRSMQTAVDGNADKLPDMVREQLTAGKDGDGNDNKIFGSDTYAAKTIDIKKKEGKCLGAVTDYITNFMTGDFYESLEMKPEDGALDMDSDVPYFGDIRLYSSPALLEVDEDNRRTFANEYVMPAVEEDLQLKTGLIVTHTT